MRLKHRQLARAAAHVEDHLGRAGFSVTWIKRNAERVALRANSDLDDAPAGICYEPKPRSSVPGSPTERKATTDQPDPIGRGVRHLNRLMGEAAHHAKLAAEKAEQAERVARSLLAMDPETASGLAGADQVKTDPSDTRKAYACAHCGTTVSNTPQDRLRAGRCEACYRYRQRTGTERPLEAEPEKRCGNPVWHEGREAPCQRPFMHDGRCALDPVPA